MTDTDSTRRLRSRLVTVTVIGVLVGAVGSVLAFTNLVPVSGDDQDERAAVVSRVEAFAKVYNTYSVDDKADYQKRMKPLLTSSYYEQFTKVTDGIFTALQDKKQTSGDPKVLQVAVQSIDDDSASALVAVDATIRAEGEAAVQRRFRWKVIMAKDGDTWRVREFQTVAAGSATTGGATTGTPESGGAAEPSQPSPSASESSR